MAVIKGNNFLEGSAKISFVRYTLLQDTHRWEGKMIPKILWYLY